MKQATVTTFCIGEYTFIGRQMVNHKIGRFYCICQILLITGYLIQFMSCSQESTRVVRKYPFGNLAFSIHAVIHCPRLTVEQVILLPCIYFNGLIQISLFGFSGLFTHSIVKIIQPGSNKGSRTIGTSVLRFCHIRLPGNATKPRSLIFRSPSRPNPIIVGLSRLFQILGILSAFKHANLCQSNPFHIVYKHIPPRVFLSARKIEFRCTFPP